MTCLGTFSAGTAARLAAGGRFMHQRLSWFKRGLRALQSATPNGTTLTLLLPHVPRNEELIGGKGVLQI